MTISDNSRHYLARFLKRVRPERSERWRTCNLISLLEDQGERYDPRKEE